MMSMHLNISFDWRFIRVSFLPAIASLSASFCHGTIILNFAQETIHSDGASGVLDILFENVA